MIYHDVQQGSDDWFRLRLGLPTSSEFDKILTPKTMKPSASQEDFIDQLIGDALSLYGPERPESYTSRPMRHGQDTEEEARRFYAMERSVTVVNGGFCRSESARIGASPDGLIGLKHEGELHETGGLLATVEGTLELKCPMAKTHAGYIRKGGLPDDYKWQVHGHLVVTGAKWADFLSYHPGLPPLLVRVLPDETTDLLRQELARFLEKFSKALTKVRSMT